MTLKTTKLRDAITFALAAGATTIAGTGAAFAQETGEPATLDRIEVTGSRIKRAELETSQPVFNVTREDIQAQGLTSVGDVIQNLTANGSALNSTINNGGNGETRVSLRNLGSNRTLVLVNGRRWVGGTGLGGAVDLNTIPTAAVERIEVLKDGASAVYGSDAIAGVVNVILRTDYTGAEANAYYGQFGNGDGSRESYDLTIGTADDRFSVLFGAGYVKEDPVMAGDRAISAVPIFGTGPSFNSSTIPNGRFALCPSGVVDPTSGACTGGQTRPDGTGGYFTYDPGSDPSDWRNYVGSQDSYNFAPDNYLLTPQERTSIFGRASVNITENTSAFIQGTYNNRLSEQLLAAMPVVLGAGPGAGVQARTITISPDNMYNPFGVPVNSIQYRVNESGGRSFKQNVHTYAFSGGLEGSFEAAGRFFSWDAGTVYGKNSQADETTGLFNILALRNALGPSEMRDGVPTCVQTPGGIAIAGCVPLNLLGGAGSITPAMQDYIGFVAHDEFGYEMTQYFANISGEIVDLPGGMMAFAAGVEHRKESGFDQPDALINSGNTTGNARTATRGAYSVDEVYAELSFPLLRDVPFAQELEFNVASRYSDYDTFGDTVNSKFGFKWRPIDDLLVRGNWGEGFRAPSIAELYSGVSDSFQQISDPCSTTFGGTYGSLSPEQQARCHAQGVPVGGYDQGNAQIRISVGGNPNLLPEKSVTKTLGMVWSPGFFEGFDVSLDWWNIRLTDAIDGFTGQEILDECIREGGANFCSLYNRAANGSIDTLLSAGVNFGSTEVEGYDMTMNYRLPEQSWGRLAFSWDTTYLSNFENDDDGDNRTGEYYDRDNNWRIRSNLMTRWEMGDWGATLSTRFYSRQEESCPFYYNDYGFGELCTDAILGPGTEGGVDVVQEGSFNKMGATTYHDLSVYWSAPWNAKITLGVNNVTEKDPPVSYVTFANSFDPQYEVPGRFYYLRYNQKF